MSDHNGRPSAVTLVPRRPEPGSASTTPVPDPFLHFGSDRIYSPLLDRTLFEGDEGYEELRALVSGRSKHGDLPGALADHLHREGWLVDSAMARAHDFRLKYVSLETHTVCNQKCYFCPVSVDPRKSYFMPDELFHSIVEQLTAWRDTIEAIWLMLYNEPTLDPRFLDHCFALMDADLPVAVNTNASGLTPRKIDALCDRGGIAFLSVNLSTMDRERYARDRGADQLEIVLRNLDYAAERDVAGEMVIMVLGDGDDRHEAEIAAVRERYGSSRFEIQSDVLMDRAGYLEVGVGVGSADGRLCGCENVGSRPLQHLHVTPQGRVVLCCQDYDETHIAGDLRHQTIAEVLTGDRMAAMRREAYGLAPAGESFLCNECVFALRCRG